MEILAIRIMFGPNNKWHQGSHPTVAKPKGYKLYSSSQYGAEDWNRYWWWTGRLFPLVRGDIVQETYRIIPKTDLQPEELLRITPESDAYFKPRSVNRNFLVVEDLGRALVLLPTSSIPRSSMNILRGQPYNRGTKGS
jgi:hypothetical protein